MTYASLPQEVVQKAEQKINSITFGGQPLRQGGTARLRTVQ